MAIPTAFLNLLKAAVGEKYSVAVTNSNLDLIDAGVKASRDETDKRAAGIIKFTDEATSSTGLAGTSIVNNLLYDITLKAGRTYRVNYRCDHNTTAVNMGIVINFRHGSGTGTGGTALGESTIVTTSAVASQGQTNRATVTWKQVTDAGPLNIKAESARLTTTAGYNISNRHLEIEDLGVIP